jgi:predicted patatin/cPLA2 family phospholipase
MNKETQTKLVILDDNEKIISNIGQYEDTGDLVLRDSNDLPRGNCVMIIITDKSEDLEGYYLFLDGEISNKPCEKIHIKQAIETEAERVVMISMQQGTSKTRTIPNPMLKMMVKDYNENRKFPITII